MTPIVILSMRALLRGRRVLVALLLLAVSPLLALAYVAGEPHPDGMTFAVNLFENLALPVLMPLATALFASSALGNEVEDRTLIYLTLRPISRLGLAAGKLLATALVAAALLELSLLALYLIVARTASLYSNAGVLSGLLLAGLGGAFAYSALFLLLGLLAPRRGLLLAFIYVLAWEGVAAGLSGALATLSVRGYVQGFFDSVVADEQLATLQRGSAGGTASALVLLAITIVATALTAVQLRRMELP